MKLCELIVQFFDSLLKKANFKEAEHKDLCKRLFKVWLCRSAITNFPLMKKDHRELYLEIVQNLDASTSKALVQLERLADEIRQQPENYTKFRQNMLDTADTIIQDLIKQTEPHLNPDEIHQFHHTFRLIKDHQLPAITKKQ